MRLCEGGAVLELGARFHAADEEQPPGVRIDSLVQEGWLQSRGQGGGERGSCQAKPKHPGGGLGEEASPALLGNTVAESAQLATDVREQLAADDEGDEGGVDERLHDVSLGGGHLVCAVAALELAKEELDDPAGGVDLRNLLRGELLRRDVGQIQVVGAADRVADSDQAKALQGLVPHASVDATLAPPLALRVDDAALESVEEMADLAAERGHRASTPATVQGDHHRVGGSILVSASVR